MSITRLFAASALIVATASAAFAGPVATGNAAGGTIAVVAPAPVVDANASAAVDPLLLLLPGQQAPAASATAAPVQSGFVAGYVASFSR